MKPPKLIKLNKKARIKEVKKFKQALNEIVKDCQDDIRPYLVKDIMMLLKKKGIIYAKNSKKNTKKGQKEKR